MGIITLLLCLHAQASAFSFTSSSLIKNPFSTDTIRSTITIQLYPNPSSSWVFIKHPIVTTKLAQIVVSNFKGNVIQKINTKPQSQQTIINISHLPTGMYLITWVNGNETATARLNKE